MRKTIPLWLAGGLLLACAGINLSGWQPAARPDLSATVAAMQATLTTLEDIDRPAGPQIIVITPPPPHTPTPSPPPLPTSTSLPPAATPDRTIVIIVTPTPTAGPQTNMYAAAPIITAPRAGTVVEEGRQILLFWGWNGLLGPGEYFDVKIRPDGRSRAAYVAWEQATAHDLTATLPPGRYFWTVQVVKGYYQNNSGQPEDRVLEAYLSPESEPRLLIVAQRNNHRRDNPRSVSQADPPGPLAPYGLAAGSAVFVLFAAFAHLRLWPAAKTKPGGRTDAST